MGLNMTPEVSPMDLERHSLSAIALKPQPFEVSDRVVETLNPNSDLRGVVHGPRSHSRGHRRVSFSATRTSTTYASASVLARHLLGIAGYERLIGVVLGSMT